MWQQPALARRAQQAPGRRRRRGAAVTVPAGRSAEAHLALRRGQQDGGHHWRHVHRLDFVLGHDAWQGGRMAGQHGETRIGQWLWQHAVDCWCISRPTRPIGGTVHPGWQAAASGSQHPAGGMRARARAHPSCRRRRRRSPRTGLDGWCGRLAAPAPRRPPPPPSAGGRRRGRRLAAGCPGRRPGCARRRPPWGCAARRQRRGGRHEGGLMSARKRGPRWARRPGPHSAPPCGRAAPRAGAPIQPAWGAPGAAVEALGSVCGGGNLVVHVPQARPAADVGARAVGRDAHRVQAPQVQGHRPRQHRRACVCR